MGKSGGANCAVSRCSNYSGKAKKEGRDDLIFHRFPKDADMLKIWAHRCRRKGKWNPIKCYICSDHFTSEDYDRDLKAELLGYASKRRLKKGAIPTLKLPHNPDAPSASGLRRRERMEAKQALEVRKQTVEAALKESAMDICPPESPAPISHADDVIIQEKDAVDPDYKALYHKLLTKHTAVESDLKVCTEKLQHFENECRIDYKAINEELGTTCFKLKKQLKTAEEALRKTKASSEKNINSLWAQTKSIIETKAKESLETIFSPNEVKLLMGYQKRVHWTSEEISKAFKLRYLSKRAYIFVKDELHYPLPALSSLRRWAANVKKMRVEEDPILPSNEASDTCSTDTASEASSLLPAERMTDSATDMPEVTKEGLEYLAGCIVKNFQEKYPELGTTTPESNDHNYVLSPWTVHLSDGGLSLPSEHFLRLIHRMERLFNKITKGDLPKGAAAIRKVTWRIGLCMEGEIIDKTIIEAFVKQRICIRAKYINHNFAYLQKQRMLAQLKKITKSGCLEV